MVEFQKAIELSRADTTFTSNLAYVYALAGRRGEAVKILNDRVLSASVRDAGDRVFVFSSQQRGEIRRPI